MTGLTTDLEKREMKNNVVKATFAYDECPEDPREYGNLGVLFSYHTKYIIEGAHDRENHFKLTQALNESRKVRGYNPYRDYTPYELYELASQATDTIAEVLPVYMYDHCGITINNTGFLRAWDSGQIGFIIATRRDVLSWFGKKRLTRQLRERTRERLKLETDILSKYASGSLLLCTIEFPNGEIEVYRGIYSVEDWVCILEDYVGKDYEIVVQFKDCWVRDSYADDIEALAEKRGLSVTIEEPRDLASCF